LHKNSCVEACLIMALVDQIDNGLRRYYKHNDTEYNGEFKERCEENGFDDDDSINEEMGSNIDESQLADEDFLDGLCPWLKKEGDERRKYIFEVLQQCYKDPEAYANNAEVNVLAINGDHFNLTKEDVEKAKKIAQEQAPAIFNAGFSNDEVLCMMMAVNQKTGKNYMLYLVDMFLREAVYHHYKGQDGVFETSEWQANNQHIKELKNISIPNSSKNAGDVAIAAVKSYLHRVAPKVMLKSTSRIKGSYLQDISQYISQTVTFVSNLSKQQGTCPFQYDSVFAFQEKIADDSKSDYESDDDDEDDNENGGGASDESESTLGDIQELLNKNKMRHEASTWKAGREQRSLLETYKNFANKEGKEYPRFNRFISILDLRKTPKGQDPALFVFKPVNDAKVIKPNPSFLNFFHNSKMNILPDEPDSKDEMEKRKVKLQAMSQGPQITLSFHVESEESMRCYFYVNGQCTRFMPEDLKMLLPLFFEETKENVEYAQGKEINRLMQEMKGKLRDADFEAFLKKFKVTCPMKELQ